MAVSMPRESDGGRADAEPKPEGRGGPVQPEEFLEAGKRRLAGDTARSATTSEVKDLKR